MHFKGNQKVDGSKQMAMKISDLKREDVYCLGQPDGADELFVIHKWLPRAGKPFAHAEIAAELRCTELNANIIVEALNRLHHDERIASAVRFETEVHRASGTTGSGVRSVNRKVHARRAASGGTR